MGKDWTTLLKRYETQLEQLLTLSEQLLSLLSALHLPTLHNKALALKQRIASETLKVTVIGASRRGKSTLIQGLQSTPSARNSRFLFSEVTWGERSTIAQPVDAALIVLGCDSPPTQEEVLEIDRLEHEGHKALFFICNRFDRVERSEQARMKRHMHSLLSSLAHYNEKHVFFTDARAGQTIPLYGERLQTSELSLLEDTLYEFLVKDSGWARFIQYVAEFMTIGRDALPVLSAQKQLQHTNQQELQARYFKAVESIEQLEQVRRHVNNLFTLTHHALTEKVRSAANSFFLDSLAVLEESVQPLALYPLSMFAGNAQERLAKEEIAFLADEILHRFEVWVRSILQPLLQERLRQLEPELDEYARQFASDLERIWTELFGETIVMEKSGESIWTAGINETMQQAITRASSAVLHDFSFHWHPSVLLTHLQGNEELRLLLTHRAEQAEIKSAVGQQYRRELLSTYQQHTGRIVEIVGNELQRVQQEVDSALALDLQIIHSVIFSQGEGQGE